MLTPFDSTLFSKHLELPSHGNWKSSEHRATASTACIERRHCASSGPNPGLCGAVSEWLYINSSHWFWSTFLGVDRNRVCVRWCETSKSGNREASESGKLMAAGLLVSMCFSIVLDLKGQGMPC